MINLSREAAIKLSALCIEYHISPGDLLSALVMSIDVDALKAHVEALENK